MHRLLLPTHHEGYMLTLLAVLPCAANGALFLSLSGSTGSPVVNWSVGGTGLTNPAGNGVAGASATIDVLAISDGGSDFWTPVANLPASGADLVNGGVSLTCRTQETGISS